MNMLFTTNEKLISEANKGETLVRNIPFSYYNSQIFSECVPEQEEKKNEDKNEKSQKDIMESQIKNKYNLIIPAILIELQDEARSSVQLEKNDLKNLLASLGGIKHIEISSFNAYVLYEHYFSALIAYNILNEIIANENRSCITVKLFTKEEDEEKQKKIYNQNKMKKSILDNIQNKKALAAEKSVKLGKERNFSKNNKDSLLTENNSLFSDDFAKEFSLLTVTEKSKESDENESKIKEEKVVRESAKSSTPNCTEYDPKYLPWNYSQNENKTTQSKDYNPNFSTTPSTTVQPPIFPIPDCYYPPTAYPHYSSATPNALYNFNTMSNQLYLLKFVCNYDIQIENDQSFKVTKRLIGNKGLALKKILFDCCIKFNDLTTKIRLRGKGSGYKEGFNHSESEDPLQLCISSLNYYSYLRCCEAVDFLLNQIYRDYFNFQCQSNSITEAIPKKIVKYEYVVNRF